MPSTLPIAAATADVENHKTRTVTVNRSGLPLIGCDSSSRFVKLLAIILMLLCHRTCPTDRAGGPRVSRTALDATPTGIPVLSELSYRSACPDPYLLLARKQIAPIPHRCCLVGPPSSYTGFRRIWATGGHVEQAGSPTGLLVASWAQQLPHPTSRRSAPAGSRASIVTPAAGV